ncbi:MAG: dephospho-CoA kinase [Gemmatimonadota bacterium]
MLNIALTGNIAAGKSTVVRWFGEWGATVIDADQLAREAQRPGSDVLSAIAFRFGRDVILPGGELDRAALRGKVMGDEAALAALNAIVHPAVRHERDALLAAARRRGDLIVVNDIPLLFEAGDPESYDVIVLVDAPESVRRSRLVTRRGLSELEADRMIALQLPSAGKRASSHFVIDNAGTLEQLRERAAEVWSVLRRRAAEQARDPGLDRLVAVVAPGRRWAASCAGTLLRVAESGVATYVIGVDDTRDDAEHERLVTAAERLGAELIESGGLDRAEAAIQRLAPAAVIGAAPFGWPDILPPRGPTVLLRPERRRLATVTMDVRPWLDAKARMLAEYPGGPRLEDQDGTERFRDESTPGAPPRVTLLPAAAPTA